MKTATSLALVAIGAIFAFAITRSPSFLNLQVAGWVLMLTGGAGALVPRRGSGWLRRSTVLKADPDADSAETAVNTKDDLGRPRFSRILVPGGRISSRRSRVPEQGHVERETIEEYIEE
jgi:hypothetical protein